MRLLWAAALVLAGLAGQTLAQTVTEPDEYREDDYRAPVPSTLSGATVIGPEEAYALWQQDAGFLDVFPRAPKPANLPKGTIWRDKPHESIPGAVWLPNVGYGQIAPVTSDYFRKGLETVTGNDQTRPVVIFCLEDCWMSWNAAKRAVSWGYSDVYWFPEGVDGWRLWEYPVERANPEPGA